MILPIRDFLCLNKIKGEVLCGVLILLALGLTDGCVVVGIKRCKEMWNAVKMFNNS